MQPQPGLTDMITDYIAGIVEDFLFGDDHDDEEDDDGDAQYGDNAFDLQQSSEESANEV